jgi:hypothetical protein
MPIFAAHPILMNSLYTLNKVIYKKDNPADDESVTYPQDVICIWNEYNRINFPPIFPALIDGTIGTDGVTQLFMRRKLVRVGQSNDFVLETDPKLLSTIIFEKDVADESKTLANTVRGFPPTGYNPILIDSEKQIYYLKISVWIADSLYSIIRFVSGIPVTIKQPVYITFVRYIGMVGGGTDIISNITGYTGPINLSYF